MKKDWFALGLILIIAGVILLSVSNTIADHDNYVKEVYIDNQINYNEGLPTQVFVSAYFNIDQQFSLNFTKGAFWGDKDDQMEPANINFAPNTTIEAYKAVTVYIYTPSGDAVHCEVEVVSGTSPFAVIYYNQSADFVPLLGGNLTFTNPNQQGARIEGRAEHDGNYTFDIAAIDPYVTHLNATDLYDVVAHGSIRADPPLQIGLYRLEIVATKPYFASFLSLGASLVIVGLVPFVLAKRPKKKHPYKPPTKGSKRKP